MARLGTYDDNHKTFTPVNISNGTLFLLYTNGYSTEKSKALYLQQPEVFSSEEKKNQDDSLNNNCDSLATFRKHLFQNEK